MEITITNKQDYGIVQNWLRYADKLIDFVSKNTKDAKFSMSIDKEPSGKNPEKYAIENLFKKGFKHYKAINCLCKNGFGQDALILVRVLLEISFYMRYVNFPVNQHERFSRARGFVDADVQSRKFYIEQVLKVDPEFISGNDAFMKEFDRIIEAQGNSEKWPEKVKQTAEKIKDGEIYAKIYRFLSSFVHSKPMSFDLYILQMPDGETYFDVSESDMAVHLAIYWGTIIFHRTLNLWRKSFKRINEIGIKNIRVGFHLDKSFKINKDFIELSPL